MRKVSDGITLPPSREDSPIKRFARDISAFASRFVDIMAEGSKGVVLMMMASPKVEDGVASVEVKK